MDIDTGFQPSLLSESTEKRYEYYKVRTVAHPILKKAYETIMGIIHEPAGKQIVMVIGPPRSGKTFLLEWLESELKYAWAQVQSSDPGRIPIASIEVPSRDTLKPSWALIYERILKALEEPLIDKKIIYGDVIFHRSVEGKLRVPERASGGKLRIAVEEALKHRHPFAFFFDEFQHLLSMAGLSWQDQMDCVKSLANMTRTLLVLFGTYEGLDLVDLSDQLMLRTKVVHLRRYGSSADDVDNFEGTINSFQVQMPLRKPPDLLQHSEYIYERTLGCVGSLRNWLLQAYRTALQDDAPTLSLAHLKKHAPLSARQAKKLLTSVEQDELKFTEIIGEEDLEDCKDQADHNSDGNVVAQSQAESPASRPPEVRPRSKRYQVGERKPERDPTGRK